MLKDKVSIITGSAAGIGAASALKLAELGSHVVINYTKSVEEAEATTRACQEHDVDVLMVRADIGEDTDCQALAQAAMDKWGRIDILVNNAGTTKFADHAQLDALDKSDFQDIYGVNVVGAYQMIRAVAPSMKDGFAKQGEAGAVVNISSIAGVTGIGSSVAYAASKGALNTMTLSLARSLSPDLRVNAVCPGFVGTRWFRDRFGEEKFAEIVNQQKKNSPLKRAGKPEDVAGAVAFFCGPWSSNVTGETLLVDAGLHLDMAPLTAR